MAFLFGRALSSSTFLPAPFVTVLLGGVDFGQADHLGWE
ncbi:hypothetical protein CathTA2_0823 [Caldalkalibacillus thermarum TA2.A1]|uniref:Uncharacterized protein n=1 Tax=Caldalkalibacillus thermarum (strain TA2.A1) TaxID=986075 RepID=F5L4W0_CALTT|nr:hypothetical protein CathTA2_0823 [Caldalkalibacillus thermarum TA2.A1]